MLGVFILFVVHSYSPRGVVTGAGLTRNHFCFSAAAMSSTALIAEGVTGSLVTCGIDNLFGDHTHHGLVAHMQWVVKESVVQWTICLAAVVEQPS